MTPPKSTETDSFAALLEQWPNPNVIARDLAIPVSTVRAWQRRNAIPPGYWDQLVAHAKSLGLRGVSYARFKRAEATRHAARRAAKAPSVHHPSVAHSSRVDSLQDAAESAQGAHEDLCVNA
jgi:hypothetical protein